jgi:hypothetical protein
MISARHALLRQAQEYFHTYLLGVIKWDDVVVDKPIPIPPVKGNREQGKFKDIVVAHFDGFRMELISPFESEEWPLGRVRIVRGNDLFQGPLDAASWALVANFIKLQKEHGDDDGRIASGEDWGR